MGSRPKVISRPANHQAVRSARDRFNECRDKLPGNQISELEHITIACELFLLHMLIEYPTIDTDQTFQVLFKTNSSLGRLLKKEPHHYDDACRRVNTFCLGLE